MTIHPIRLRACGGCAPNMNYLDKMQDRVIKFITKHSRISEEKFRQMMFCTDQLARDRHGYGWQDAVRALMIVGGLREAVAKFINQQGKRGVCMLWTVMPWKPLWK